MLTLGERMLLDQASLGVRLAEQDVRLAASLVLQLLCASLRRDERLPEQRLEVAVPGDVGFEALELVLEVGTLAPDLLEALDDLVEQLVGRTGSVPPEPAP